MPDEKIISKSDAIALVAPFMLVGVAFIGLFWQQGNYLNSFQQNYLSLREHAEYQTATRRELDNAKAAADAQITSLQKQLDSINLQLRTQLEEKVRELQLQIDQLKIAQASDKRGKP
jgi:hypothetical protein